MLNAGCQATKARSIADLRNILLQMQRARELVGATLDSLEEMRSSISDVDHSQLTPEAWTGFQLSFCTWVAEHTIAMQPVLGWIAALETPVARTIQENQ